MRWLLVLLFLVGCTSPVERCVNLCLKQGKTVDNFEYIDGTPTCDCTSECDNE